MKIRNTWCLGLLLISGALATAQPSNLPPPPTSCDGATLAAWGSQFHFDHCHTGYNPYEVILSPATVGDLVLDWQYRTNGEILSSPTVANGIVYLASLDHNVYALNAATGAKLWSFTTGNGVDSSPVVANGVVYVGSYDTNVYALNASTGAKLWSFATGNAIDSPPAVANGVVYVGSYDHNIYALNASTGAKLWSFTTGGAVYSSPAVANGVVYVGSYDQNVYALNARPALNCGASPPAAIFFPRRR